jgi:formate hydrogenlyase subunit 6/NADH:ubiquinone oxidoreductase subunit I
MWAGIEIIHRMDMPAKEERMSKSSKPVVDMLCCTRCGLCVETCPCHAIELTEEGIVFNCADNCHRREAGEQDCGGWCLCEEVCPTGAIDCTFDIVLDEACIMPKEDPAAEPGSPLGEPSS